MSKLGQYFTTHPLLKETVATFILNHPSTILEPSVGRGDLITSIKIPVTFDAYEIDETLGIDGVIYGDFMTQQITKKYVTIVGNPPYIRTSKGNLYIDFTEKCFHLLEDDGELIFIVPSDFLKLTSASKLLNLMMEHGTFTHIFHPHDENMFENASIDVIVFRYCKNNSLEKRVLYNDKLMYITNSNGLITFDEKENKNSVMFQDVFDIYVGLVSGKEDVYKSKLGNIEVINGDKVERYIYIEKFPSGDEKMDEHLLKHKDALMKRGIRKFNEKNWFEWGAQRNISEIRENTGEECIYLYNLTRKKEVAFLGQVNYFGGSLLMLKPKMGFNKKILEYMNSDRFKDNFMFSGRFKIGHRQISNSYIPSEYL